jgi:hypothetical protein
MYTYSILTITKNFMIQGYLCITYVSHIGAIYVSHIGAIYVSHIGAIYVSHTQLITYTINNIHN